MRIVCVRNETRKRPLAARVEIASGSWTRVRGLLGRTHLNPQQALWIRPSSGVHTLFMRFAIDVVGLDSQMRVVRIWPCLAPWRITAVIPRIRSVIELRAGQAALSGLTVGDQLRVVETGNLETGNLEARS